MPANDFGNHGYYCGEIFNKLRIGWLLICSDGSIKNPGAYICGSPPIRSCPNGSWTLDSTKSVCSRPNFSCIINTDSVSEEKLLAAMVYGEASTLDDYEEMAGIAYAITRRRDAANMLSVNMLIKKYKNFSYVVTNGNERFRKLMCSESREQFQKAFMAAENALNKGFDYANGGCFWDGIDLKTNGKYAYKYVKGFRYSEPSHNILSTPEPPHKRKKGEYGYYDNMYISTAAYGKTIFWKVDDQYLKAKGASQCK